MQNIDNIFCGAINTASNQPMIAYYDNNGKLKFKDTLKSKCIILWKKFFKIKPYQKVSEPELKMDYIGLTSIESYNSFTGKTIKEEKVMVFRKNLNGISKEIFAKYDGNTFYFDCEIYDATGKLVIL